MKVLRFMVIEVLVRSLRDERRLCLRMREEGEKNLLNGGLGVTHGRAKFLEFCWFWQGKFRHGRARFLAS